MMIREIMERSVKTARPDQTVREAAELMEEAGVGCLPVVDGGLPVGMLTDRDIAVRVDAYGKDPMFTRVGEIMTGEFIYCHDNQESDEVLNLMFEKGLQRLPVVSRSGHALLGIVSLTDLAEAVLDNKFVAMTLASGRHYGSIAKTG
jgi:CBS domain-containing protein